MTFDHLISAVLSATFVMFLLTVGAFIMYIAWYASWNYFLKTETKTKIGKALCRCKHDYQYIGDTHFEPGLPGGMSTITELHVCKRCNGIRTKERSA